MLNREKYFRLEKTKKSKNKEGPSELYKNTVKEITLCLDTGENIKECKFLLKCYYEITLI